MEKWDIFYISGVNDLMLFIRTLPSGVPNAKYLAFDTQNTKKHLSWDILNVKIFYIDKQYALKYESVRTNVIKF